MFETRFSHYLSYGASDQQTVTDLRDVYDGLLIPGTVAAFQKEGTGGFVLSLSASKARIPYVIDPRSPLFQQAIPSPKKSHIALAGILGLPSPSQQAPSSTAFDDALVATVATKWIHFNNNYQSKAGGKFAKYAKRLGEDGLNLNSASAPQAILPPYFVANSVDDPWWHISTNIYSAANDLVGDIAPNTKCIRVIATEQSMLLDSLCAAVPDGEEFVCWVSDLNEVRAYVSDLAAYGLAVKRAQSRGQKIFALYGGFFSVLLGSVGLRGISHGIGYGESRNWIELPQSGPPPQRYYLEPLHRYVSQELAEQLWKTKVYRCGCPVCVPKSPLLLEYHEVMKHSVHCRQKEIDEWSVLSLGDSTARLKKEYASLQSSISTALALPIVHRQAAIDASTHLSAWIAALAAIESTR